MTLIGVKFVGIRFIESARDPSPPLRTSSTRPCLPAGRQVCGEIQPQQNFLHLIYLIIPTPPDSAEEQSSLWFVIILLEFGIS